MGQKVHPYGFRLGVIREPKSLWFAEGNQYRDFLIQDMKIRQFISNRLRDASVAEVVIDRTAGTVTVTIRTAKPGIVIGRAGQDVEQLRRRLERLVGGRVRVNVEETPDPDINAQLIAENIARQIERRVAFRRAMRQAVERAMRMGAQGVRCMVSGRLGGAEIARSESAGPEGRVPLQTLRADVEYGFAEARTGYGNIGCKVWIYKGDIMPARRRVRRPDLEVDAESLDEDDEAIEASDAVAEGASAEVGQIEAAPVSVAAPAAAHAGSAVPISTTQDEDPLVAALQQDEGEEQADEEP
jgi:small subunit ribosomal protein S3